MTQPQPKMKSCIIPSVPTVPNCKRSLKHQFSDPELLIIGKYSAELHSQHEALENDKKRVVTDFSARLASVENDQGIAARKISSGYEYRETECRVLLDAPVRGQKTLMRLDVDEVAVIEDMTDADRQLLIKFEEDQKPKAPAKAKMATVAANGTDDDEPPRIESAESLKY